MAEPARLSPIQLQVLARLTEVTRSHGLYLAGGSAIAFHLGHRVSRDLDLFGSAELDLDALQRALIDSVADVEVVALTDATLQIKLEGLPIDLVRYRYPLFEEPGAGPAGTAVAGRLDLGVMKLAALAHRGLYRDFWDLYALLFDGGLALDALLDAYRRRFGKREPDLYHVIRALTYFDDAESEPLMPAGMSATLWGAIKNYFLVEAPAAFARRTGESE